MPERRTRKREGGRVAVELFSNLPSTTVSSGGTTAPAGGTTETWTVASSASFPAASSSDAPPTQFHVADIAANSEIIAVTNVSGATWTVTRGAEGTTPVTHSAGFTVFQVASAGALTQLARVNWVNAVTQYGATTSGDSTTQIQNALLAFGTLAGWAGAGGTVYLPPGDYSTSKPLIIPAGVWLVGDGWSSVVDLTTGSNCDIIQFATYNSAAQAAILGVSAGSIGNAFYAGVEKVQLHGDAFHTTVAGYHHGINITTSPLNSTAPTDPEFDPLPTVRDVYIKACTGDGINHSGRSGACFERVYSAFHNGCAFAPSYDTTMVDCLAAFCGAGFYLNHASDTGTGCKSYNHNDYTWVSGTSYAPNAFGGRHTMAIYSGTMYFCISAVSGSTPPPSDPTHWTAVSATAPQANGTGYYWDTNSSEQSWASTDAQQNSTNSFYCKGPNGGGSGIVINGVSNDVNFNNGQAAFDATNPLSYAHIVLDGVTGVNAQISTQGTASLHQVICTSANSPGQNTLTVNTDGLETSVFAGGTPGYALVNGHLYSGTGIAVNTALVTVPVTLTLAATVSVNAALGNDFRLTLTASGDTIGNPSSSADGQVIRFQIAQDGTGGHTVSWGANYDFGAAGSPTLSTGASKVDVIGFVYNASLSKWLFLGSALGN